MVSINKVFALCLGLLLCFTAISANAAGPVLRVALLDDTPPASYLDAEGKLTGFYPSLARALCAEMKADCQFHAAKLDYLIDELATDHFDIVATGLLKTPERSKKVLFTHPVYRSLTMWFARPGVKPGRAGLRVSTFKGSAQESYSRTRHWETITALDYNQMLEQLSAGIAQAALVPLMTCILLRQNEQFATLGLESSVLEVPELGGYARFAINPRHPELREQVNRALEKIKRNGTYDRINSEFLPFRVE